MKRRVVITGIGVVSPIGSDVKTFWENAISGKSGIRRITKFNPEGFPVQIAGEVKDFNPEKYFDKKEIRRTDPFIQFAIAASVQAVEDSGLDRKSVV